MLIFCVLAAYLKCNSIFRIIKEGFNCTRFDDTFLKGGFLIPNYTIYMGFALKLHIFISYVYCKGLNCSPRRSNTS